MRKDFVFNTQNNDVIRLTAYGVESLETAPLVILVHGFKGFKDWGFWPETGQALADIGFFVLSFNFSHNGISENLTEFTDLEKFANNTYSLEVKELSQIIDAYKNNFFGRTVNNKIGLLGHSRGGAISILTAALKAEINCLCVWASIANLDRYSARQKEEWRKSGFFEVLNSRTRQLMRINVSLLEDFENNSAGLLNLEKSVKELKKPFLIIHGDQDMAVPIKEGEQLYEWADKSLTSFYKLETAGHTFDIVHPFEGRNNKFNELLEKTILFFKSNLF